MRSSMDDRRVTSDGGRLKDDWVGFFTIEFRNEFWKGNKKKLNAEETNNNLDKYCRRTWTQQTFKFKWIPKLL